MIRRPRPAALLAVAAGATVVAVTVPAARAEELGVGWRGSFDDSGIVDGYEATGSEMVIPVSFEGPPGSVITDITLELEPVGDACDSHRWFQPLDDGDDGVPGPTTPPTTAPAPTSPDSQRPTATWTFRVDPRCNGTYDISVVARADPPGVVEPGSEGTESQPLEVRGARVSLMAPSPVGVSAQPGADRTVTVRWQHPPAWAGSAPTDAYGYRVQRTGADGVPVMVADDLTLSTTTVVDDDLVGATSGRYRYEVVAMRRNAAGDLVLSDAGIADLDLGAAPGAAPAATVRPAAAGTGVRVGTSAGVGQPAVGPQLEVDPGFDPELDYSGAELGSEEAIVPDDASLFASDDPVGVGLVVPGAVALCLAVWAGHLRHLARRAAPPAL